MYLYVRYGKGGPRVLQCICWGQRTTFGSCFSPSTMVTLQDLSCFCHSEASTQPYRLGLQMWQLSAQRWCVEWQDSVELCKESRQRTGQPRLTNKGRRRSQQKRPRRRCQRGCEGVQGERACQVMFWLGQGQSSGAQERGGRKARVLLCPNGPALLPYVNANLSVLSLLIEIATFAFYNL